MKYREFRDPEERREYQREWDRQHRSAKTRQIPTKSDTIRPNPTKEEEEVDVERSKTKAPASAFALPGWIPEETWKGYTTMRAKIRKPMTDRARDLVIKKLLGMKQAGQDPVAVLDQSVRNSWTDIYAIKPETAGEAAPTNGWWSSDQSMLAKARELKISTEGLTSYQLKSKITEKLTPSRAH